jgi:hypothetical protein
MTPLFRLRKIDLRLLVAGAAALALAGCAPDDYRRDANRQVQKLIKERQDLSTGYTPEAIATTTTQPAATKKSYDTLPVTQNHKVVEAPIQRVRLVLEATPAGPPPPTDSGQPDMVRADVFEQTSRSQRATLEYGPPAALGKSTKLELFSAINYAVQNSRAYQNEMESLYLSALDVTLERHLFTPRPFVTTDVQYTGGQSNVEYRSALSITQRAGVRQKLPYGGEIIAEGLVQFVNALNDNVTDGEDAQLALRGSIPLWRGAGMVNLEGLISSERELIYATRSFERYRRSFAVDIATRYFRVLTRYQSLRNRLINYRNLLDLTDRTQALFDAGRVAALEVQRAQQSLLLAEDQLNTTQQALASDLDDFKIVIGMPIDQPLELAGAEVEVNGLDTSIGDPETLALRYRLDLQTARDRVEDARRGVSNAANGLGPQLDLNGGASLGNPTGRPGRDIDSRTLEYNAGLTLDLPIARLPERNIYRRALINLERSRRDAIELQENVLADVRTAERGIRASLVSLDIQRNGIDLARARLDNANDSLLLGRTTDSRNVVEAQSSLLQAQDAYDRARADLQIQMLQFLRDTGTLRVDPDAGVLGLAMERHGVGKGEAKLK